MLTLHLKIGILHSPEKTLDGSFAPLGSCTAKKLWWYVCVMLPILAYKLWVLCENRIPVESHSMKYQRSLESTDQFYCIWVEQLVSVLNLTTVFSDLIYVLRSVKRWCYGSTFLLQLASKTDLCLLECKELLWRQVPLCSAQKPKITDYFSFFEMIDEFKYDRPICR